jgi:two-component system, chemotaxis family, chemotaxis protein CheY
MKHVTSPVIGSPVGDSSTKPSVVNHVAHILVVDDDEMVRQVIAAALRRVGYSVEEAANGREVVEHLKLRPVNLVITDILMPERDGLETIMSLSGENRAMPIIAMTGLSSHSALYLEMARTFGALRILEKPFEMAELVRIVGEVLSAQPHQE